MSGRLPGRTREVEPLLAELAAVERRRARREQEARAARELEARARQEEADRQQRRRQDRRERAEEHRWRLSIEVARARAEAREQVRLELDALRASGRTATVRAIPKPSLYRGRGRQAWLAAAAVVVLMGGASLGVSANLAPAPQVRIAPPEILVESQIGTVATDWLLPPAPVQTPVPGAATKKAKGRVSARAKAVASRKVAARPDACASSLDPLCGLDVGLAL